jgi:hypothetical protein
MYISERSSTVANLIIMPFRLMHPFVAQLVALLALIQLDRFVRLLPSMRPVQVTA